MSDFVSQWTHLVVVDRSGDEVRTYANGIETDALDLTATALGSLSGTSPARLGGETVYEGELDEVRLYNVAVMPAWIVAAYANVSGGAPFLILGPPEAAPSTS